MNPRVVRPLANALATMSFVGLAIACLGDPASAQGVHSGAHSGGASSSGFMGGIEHGIALAATVFLAGLAPFAALVWLPASKDVGAGRDAVASFGLVTWVLLYVLAIAGVAELSTYATVASGEPLSLGLLRETLIETRVGHVWLARFGFALLTAALVTAAARSGRTAYWWAATGTAALLLMTLTQLSHAAAEGRFLPFLADWLHVAAATIWAGGLLGFVFVFLSGPLDAVPADLRAELREQAPQRFSRLAIGATMVLAATGLYAILLHVPNLAALVGTAYGRALLTKLGLLTLVFALGGASYFLRGRGPSGRLVVAELGLALAIFLATGFLTSLPPATAVSQEATPPEDVEVLEVGLDPVGESVTSGTASFREDMAAGIVLRLEAAGLPEPGASYFSQIHEGACESGQQGRNTGPEYAEVGRPPASSTMVRFDLLSARKPEYAHGGGHPSADVEFVSANDGTAVILYRLKDYDTVDELLSGGPKYIDIHASGRGDPTIACGEIN
jgi:putative copper export protein